MPSAKRPLDSLYALCLAWVCVPDPAFLSACARRGGQKRARLYSRAWQEELMRFVRAKRHGKTRVKRFSTWLKQQGLSHLAAR